jgi:hypothetical protein
LSATRKFRAFSAVKNYLHFPGAMPQALHFAPLALNLSLSANSLPSYQIVRDIPPRK